MAVELSTVRRARKQYACFNPRSSEVIEPGDLYMEHVVSPHHPEVENERWRRAKECADCYQQRTGRTLGDTANCEDRTNKVAP